MKRISSVLFQAFLFGMFYVRVIASSVIPLSQEELISASVVIFRGVVTGVECFRDNSDGMIYTRTSLRVIEPLKGTFPKIVTVVHRGGLIGDLREYQGNSPSLINGSEYVLFLVRLPNGKLTCTQGSSSAVNLIRTDGSLSEEQQSYLDGLRTSTANGAPTGDDVSDQFGLVTSSLVSGLLADGGGISARFVQPDRGEPIPVLIDADNLPTGISLSQATNAVLDACNAWAAVTKLKFTIESVQSFGAGADTISISDGKLRIQLHDNYNRINSPTTLGIGGRANSTTVINGWGSGGAVGTNEFHRTSYGYVVLERTNATMQNLATFTEVLCHEVGHALSMAHSSENPSEPNSLLEESIMYYQVHADGRGATLGAYDPPVIQQAYPAINTPPYSFNRMLDITTASPQPNVTGINSVELRGYDLQGTPLTVATNGASVNNGVFSLSGNTLRYTANSAFSDSGRLDPSGNSFYTIIYARFSDGTNSSPYTSYRVLSFNLDSFPSGASDGIPNTWMTTYFGNPNPAAGANRGASQDFDGDKMSNLNEYRTGMIPTNSNSGQIMTLVNPTNIQFQAKAYELYELLGSTNLTTWTRVMNPIVPTNSTGVFLGFTNSTPFRFFRVNKVP
jgi:hypothetical protein